MLLEDCDRSRSEVAVSERHFTVLPEFEATSYARRYELLARKLMLEKKYDQTAFLMSSQTGGPGGEFMEVAKDLSMHQFLAGLAGHVRVYLEGL